MHTFSTQQPIQTIKKVKLRKPSINSPRSHVYTAESIENVSFFLTILPNGQAPRERLCRLPANLGRMHRLRNNTRQKEEAISRRRGDSRSAASLAGMNMKRSSPLFFLEPAVRCTYKNAKRPTSGWLRDKLGY